MNLKIKKYLFVVFLISFLFINIRLNAKGYGVGSTKNNERPNCEDSIITDNNGYCIGKDEKTIYLTFDCGYENGYTEAILDVLRDTDTPAAFFITGHYLNSSEALVRKMLADGHIVGNHSYSHKDFTLLSEREIIDDIKKLEDAFYEKMNVKMSSFVRPPRGEYSLNSQKALCENGYTSVFWSLAYVDWYKDKFNGNNYSYNKVMSKIHNGAIILMHTVSKDNMVDLSKIINKLKNDGYVFKSIDRL